MPKLDCHVIDEENGLAKLASYATVAECEAYIGELEKSEPEKVARGGFGIDAPEGKVNPQKN